MKCTFLISKLLPHKTCYVSDKDYDINLGGEFRLVIHPFPCADDDNAAFYYVKQGPNNMIVIEGEGYIVTDPEKVAKHKAMGRRDFGNKDIWYYWLDDAGSVIKKERKQRHELLCVYQ